METSSGIKEQIIKNSFWSLLSSLINRAGGFILIILLSRLLMPEGFGKYSLVMAISLFFITFSDFGINQTLLRYVALGIDNDNSKSSSYFRYLLKLKLLFTTLASLILLILSYPFALYLFKDSSIFILLLIISIYVFFVSLTSFFEFLFFIKKYVRYVSIKEIFLLSLKLIGIFLIGLFVSSEFKLIGVFSLFVAASFLSFFFVLYLSKKVYPTLFIKKENKIDKKEIFRFIFFINLQNISVLILSQVSIILLGVFVAPEFVGYYNASWALITGIISLLFSFSCMLLPIFANTEEKIFQSLLKKIFRLFFIFAIPISFGLSLLSRFFIVSIYGNDYIPASIPLRIMAFLIPLIAGTDLAMASFSAKNKQKRFSIILSIFALISFSLNYLMINFLSTKSGQIVIAGISIINITIWFFCFLCAVYLLKKEFNVNIISSIILKSIISCLIMSAFILFSIKLFGEINLFSGIPIIIISAIIYFLSLFLFRGITKEDFLLIKEVFRIK
jgi:stage V sporulation protein B